jgi:hypothetical protein
MIFDFTFMFQVQAASEVSVTFFVRLDEAGFFDFGVSHIVHRPSTRLFFFLFRSFTSKNDYLAIIET